MVGPSAIANDGGSILGAANWLEGLIHGPAVTGIAVLAIAATGLSMLSGRIPVRRGLTVALGCFVLFGAPAIARGIVGSITAAGGPEPALLQHSPPPEPALTAPQPAAPPLVLDPYAGASIR